MGVFKMCYLCLFLFVSTVMCQNCKTGGEWCGDTYQCCGGCCIRNMCIDTFRDCSRLGDPCLQQYCPGGSVCGLYQPKCSGCEVQTECIFVNSEENEDFEMSKLAPMQSSCSSLGPFIFINFFMSYSLMQVL